jgi:hypothetical protein
MWRGRLSCQLTNVGFVGAVAFAGHPCPHRQQIHPNDRMVMMDTHLMTPLTGILRISVLLERQGVAIGIWLSRGLE